MRLLDEFEKWMQLQFDLKESTRVNYLSMIQQLDLNHLRNSLAKIRQTKSQKTFKQTVIALRQFSKFLQEDHPKHKLIDQIAKVKQIKSPHSVPHKPYSINDTKTILSTAKGWRRTALHIAFYAGLRQSEIRNLNIDHVDLEKKTITVYKGKGDKFGIVAIPDVLVGVLRRWIQIRSLNKKVNGPQLLFTYKGTRPHLASGGTLDALSKKLGFRVGWHRARATYGTVLFKKTKDGKLVQNQLRHQNLSTTNSYIHATLEEAISEMEKLGDIYDINE